MSGKKVMIATSAGGHWVEMRRLLPAFEGCELSFVGVYPEPDADLGSVPYYPVRDVSRSNPQDLVPLFRQLAKAVRTERPDVVITTGAAPGLLALIAGKYLTGSRTIWIDSIASTEKLSMSGRMARRFADAWLVQWPHLAKPGGPEYWGAIF